MAEERLEIALNLLKEKNVKKGLAFPALFRLLWKLGINVPPPYFNSYLGNSLLSALYMFVFLGLWMKLFVWDESGHLLRELFLVLLSACLFGLFAASMIEKKKVSLDLPKWEELR